MTTDPEEGAKDGSSPVVVIKDEEEKEVAAKVVPDSMTDAVQKRIHRTRLSFHEQDVQIPASPKAAASKEGGRGGQGEGDTDSEASPENQNKRPKSILKSFQSILNGASSKSNAHIMGPRSLSNTINMR